MSITARLGTPVRDPVESDHQIGQACSAPTPLPVATQTIPARSRRAWIVTAIVVAIGVGLASGLLVAKSLYRDDAPLLPGGGQIDEVPAAVAGTAEMFTSLYLAGSSPGLETLYAGDPPEATGAWVNSSTAVSGSVDGNGVWAVTVAVDALEPMEDIFVPVGLQYFVVPISAGQERPMVLAAPSRVPDPHPIRPPAAFRGPVPADQVSVATRFLEEYLTGGSDAARYVATPNAIGMFAVAPYVAADINLVGTDSLGRIKAAVTATNERGVQHRLEYRLDLTYQEGVWEVADLSPATG